ncbi:MAG: GntR family transcriptional regulator [Thermobacillus sp.]|uniref:GntR family transcriptional regulator n=1 Tax=Thermobacillus sp. TaxID=2108467 RepID=UPI000E378EB1|nr:GntR family transcriptional regulator [Thermobacillus sp.]REK58421.1 MAG: GntR family transcriptional regulator [Thermobacillus sp.]
MLIQIDYQSDVPIYVQLTNQIIEGMASGELKPGEPLPSVRALAADLGINLHTVNKAYTHLKQEGFIQVHRQRGALVRPDPMPPADEAFRSRLESQMRPFVAEAVCRRMDETDFLDMCRRIFRHFKKEES